MSAKKRTFIYNVNVVTPEATIEDGWICFYDRFIEAIGRGEKETRQGEWRFHLTDSVKSSMELSNIFDGSSLCEIEEYITQNNDNTWESIDGQNGWVLPGFIDVHVHGGYGYDFMEADSTGLDEITRFHGLHGTAGLLATTVTAPKEELDQVLETITQYRSKPMPYTQVLGVHLEGPFISEKWPGAQNPQHIRLPEAAWLEDWIRRFPQLIRMQTLAPEVEGATAYIEALSREGIIAALGHTDATFEQVEIAVRHGLSHAVHTFNAMRGLHHREPGTVGAVLSTPGIMAEIIADGHHVHPACISLLVQQKGPDNTLLITDAIAAAGLGDGSYRLGGLNVSVRDHVARLREGDSLAGSTLTMIDAFRYAVQQAGIPVEQASRMASGTPARRLGIDQDTGSLQPGKQADVLLLNPKLELFRVWIRGRAIH